MMCKYFTYLIFLSLLPALCGSNTVSAVEEIWGEAEAASSITTPLQILDDTAASGGQYIANPTVGGASNTNPPSTGIATYNITIEEGGTYKLFLRVLCTVSGSSDDSCYIRIQGATPSATPGTGGWTNCNNIDGTMAAADTQVWFWAQARQYDSEPGNVITFDIPAGSYVLEIAYREDGLKIDGFVITNDPDVTTADLPDEIPSEEPCISKLAITNGDFETGGGVSITDVNGWYDNNAGGFWNDAWQTNASAVTPNGSNVVVFCSWDSVEGDPLAGSYLYQSIGTSSGESSVTIAFDWGHPNDTAAGRLDGLTVSVLASDGSFIANDANDVLDANGITLLDYASYDHVALGTDGEIFPVVVTLDLSKANAGDEIFLRFNNYMLEGGDPWPVLDNVQITSLITYVDAKDASDPNVAANTTFATGEELIAGDPGTSGSGADGLWRQRAGLANGGNIFESGGSWEADLNTEDCPRLMTSVDVTEGVYDVYVYFWADAAQWRIQASLENLDGDLPLYLAHDPNGEAALADASYFGEPVPMLAESNRNLWQVWIGRTGMTSTIDVYIDDDPNHLTGNARTWYDGIGYKPVLPSDPGIGNLTHSYTFENGTADDMIGDANGVLIGDANIVDGSLILDGLDDWMEMPGDVIDINSYNEITIEAWYTPTEGANTGFTMLASFGLSNPNATWMGVDYLMITSARGDDVSRAAISCGNYSDPWATESLVNGPEYDDGLLHHMVATVTATEIALYIDGELMGKSALSENNHIENISTAQAYLGKAPYGQDPEWAGTIDEFNIYNRALSEAEVLYLAGYRTACQ